MFNYYMIHPYSMGPMNRIESSESEKYVETNNSSKQLEIMNKKYAKLKKKYEQLQKQNTSLKIEITELEAKIPEAKKRKIKRRAQNQLTREWQCPFPDCTKQYASDLALNLHMKIKHNAGTKKQRIQFINNLIEASSRGTQLLEFQINFPPDFIEEYQQIFQSINLTNDTQQLDGNSKNQCKKDGL